jgi:hypothetical protein
VKRLAWLIAGAAFVASGSYVLVYIYRWEWHRALIVGLFFLAAEIGLATALVLRRLERTATAGRGQSLAPDPVVLARLREARGVPADTHHFAWLQPSDGRLNVFIPVLLGAGVVVSGLAWLVERIAGASGGPDAEHDLTSDLRRIALPDGGLVPDETELMAQGHPYADDPGLRLLVGSATGRRR